MPGSPHSKTPIEIKYKSLKYRQKVALADSKKKNKNYMIYNLVC